jgi:hypothetical protein
MKTGANALVPRYWILLVASILCLSSVVRAQSTPNDDGPTAQPAPESSPSPQASPTPSLEKQFLRNVLRDQEAIWTSPFHVHGEDAKWLVPLGLSAGALFATDTRTAGELGEGNHSTRLRISNDVSQLGSGYTAAGVAAGFYFIGRVTNNARARETGLLAGEALIDEGIVAQALKFVARRPRPTADNGTGDFFDGGSSFPSGHSATAWTLAAIVSNEYHDHALIKWGVYGLAAAVSAARYTGRNHFLSDVLVGGGIGYGIGRYVYRTHHDRSLDGTGAQPGPTKQSKLIPMIAPIYDRGQRVYGAKLNWSF